MNPQVWVSSLTFSGGVRIDFSRDDIVVIVGSNNVGKSATLRAIKIKVRNSQYPDDIITELILEKIGDVEDAAGYLTKIGRQPERHFVPGELSAFGQDFHLRDLADKWNSSDGLGPFARFFCHLLSAGERLNISAPADSIAVTTAPLVHPSHWMMQNDKLEIEVSEQFRKAFGEDLILHRVAGSKIPIHVGHRPQIEQGEDRLSFSYLKKIAALPSLEMQGDGMRSFAGILLSLATGSESILLLDEPEAFLHPPQARHLGYILANEPIFEKQLFISTHSGDVLRGILDSNKKNVRILRLQRQSNLNYANELSPEKISELWNDPLLRYSNILDGLFHEKVIVCESDSDARFYSAIADNIYTDLKPGHRRPDVMFTHCGGKDRIAVVVRALRAVGVPVSIIVDFDVLNNENPLKGIVEAAGGDWTTISHQWNRVKSAVDVKKPEIDIAQLKVQLSDVIQRLNGEKGLNIVSKEVNNLLKQASPWSIAKTTGASYIPSGEPTSAYQSLISQLKTCGIFVVEVGEVECFVRSVGNHGPKWVNVALEKDLSSNEFDAAKKFVGEIIDTAVSTVIRPSTPLKKEAPTVMEKKGALLPAKRGWFRLPAFLQTKQ